MTFSAHWLVKDRKTGEQFVTLNAYRETDFVEDGNLVPIRQATMQEVDDEPARRAKLRRLPA